MDIIAEADEQPHGADHADQSHQHRRDHQADAAEEEKQEQKNRQHRQRRRGRHLHQHLDAEGILGNRQAGDMYLVSFWPFSRQIPNQAGDIVAVGFFGDRQVEADRLAVLSHQGPIVKGVADGIIPESLIAESKGFRKECIGISPAHQVWAHICGSDLVRDCDGTVYVLEDNLRVPSGVSYMIENREVTKRILPELFENNTILPVDNYPDKLLEMLLSISPSRRKHPEVAVLTPGIYNSAYFEHAFLARSMGAELVEGGDLMVDEDDYVYMKTINGPARVDVIYRRIDDLFLDPEVFLPESALGVPGLMRAWRKGNVALANAPGCGVADDKVVYSYVPDIIRYYLDEDALLPNVPTYRCNDPNEREHVLANLESMVVKPANESGGYGMLVGPQSTAREREEFRRLVSSNPRNYIGQPALRLSTAPTLCDHTVEPRHLDLRPFILQGAETYVTAGGLTRVAMKSGSLVVNSSQGGGSKDTWIVDNEGG